MAHLLVWWQRCLLLVLVVTTLSHSEDGYSCPNGQCKHSNEMEHEKFKYTKEQNEGRWKKYLDLIEKSNVEYKECSEEDCYALQRRSDFREWVDGGGIEEEQFKQLKERNVGTHYQIINKKLYRDENCIFAARCAGNEHFILKVMKDLPDMEFIVNCHDWPKAPIHNAALPIFSFSKTPNERDILYPAWTFWGGGPAVWPIFPTGLGRWDLMSESLNKAADEWPWEKKHSIGYFRGSRTSAERDPLVLLSRDHPELVNAQYTKNQAWKSPKDTLNMPAAEPATMEEHCKYKYLFNFRGVAASFRLKHLFLCKSLVFHVGEEWIEFFYTEMKPWVHYIPVSTELTEVWELLEFVRENDQAVRQIVDRGYNFITNHLRMVDVESYWLKILQRYTHLAKWTPKRDQTLIEIKQQKEE